ncbi:homeobox-leucine zipper protein HDG5 isoform X1 [Beta vulgaris subsp. vulgaris]|uniref:homeobox-leucine zipper protein HDG5 isoform X1 n=2 Tax=Beta vulgaris subsp. vulgaris TaxID=3555 RepID=UPI0020366892|nr:homeobox-leucine zipper protein HDG5 isoform X1 [Beta vulgaris subsp. vulgaris]
MSHFADDLMSRVRNQRDEGRMYGDCQVALPSTMGGAAENGIQSITADCSSLFSSPLRNPNNNNNSTNVNVNVNAFTFMASLQPAFHPFAPIIPVKEERGKEEMMESMSGSELNMEGQGGLSGNELDSLSGDPLNQNQSQPSSGSKKKRYHRHTARQIQEMESLFRECPHPDDKQRMKLSQELGLKPRQVKFWFQNRRTQMKAQQDRTDNVILRSENDNLKNENYRLQAVLRSLVCPGCGGGSILGEVEYDEQQLRIENSRLKEELDRVCAVASRYTGRSLQTLGPSPSPATLLPHPPSLDLDMGIYSRHFQEPMPPCTQMLPMSLLPESTDFPVGGSGGGELILDEERSLAMELAMSSMDELLKMCHGNEPLWVRNSSISMDVLNIEEYTRMFPWPHHHVDPLKPHYHDLRTEATRDKALVIMNSINLVDSFLDANKWVELFPSIVSRAKTIQILASGVSGHANGSLQLMYAELQVLSPLVPTRETHFLRYCHHNVEEGMWAIVDFPVDSFQESLHLSHHSNIPRYRRRPSGCIIQDMPNGYSKVTWVEHAEILEEKPIHQTFDQYVHSTMAFGAKRWLAVLQRQCERVASLMARNVSDLGVIQSPEARKNFMKLAQRMIRTFCVNISTSGGQSWTALSDSAEDTVRITTRKIMEPGQPNGLILCAVSTTWLPYSHDQVFDLLKNEYRRSQLEALSNGSSLHEVAHIANGSHPGNCISLFRINVASNSSQNVELMLQESCTDPSGSLVVYATMEVDYIQLVMSGEDPCCIPLLPTGFSIIPLGQTNTTTNATNAEAQGQTNMNHHNTGGCLLTIGIQVHASAIPNAKLNLSSVNAINNHICSVVHQINVALGNIDGNNNANTNNNANNSNNASASVAPTSN